MDIKKDIKIYSPVKSDGIYVPMTRSLYDTFIVNDDGHEIFKIIWNSYLTKTGCQEECDRLNNGLKLK